MYQLSAIADHNDEGKEEDTLRRNKMPPRKGQGTTTPSSQASASGEAINATTSDGCHRTKKKVKKRKHREGSKREGRDTKQNAVAMLTLSDVVAPPSSTTSLIRVPALSDDEEERPGAIAMPGPPRRRDRQQIAVPMEEPPIEATAFLVVEEGGVTNEARDQIAAEVRHQVLQEACIATNVVRPPAEEEEEKSNIRSFKPRKKLAWAVVVMLVVILCVVLGVLLGRGNEPEIDEAETNEKEIDEPETNETTIIEPEIDFTNGFCEDQPFQLNGNMMPLFPQYTDVRNNLKNCPLRLTKECVTLTSASAYLELDLCNMNEFSTNFTYEISADHEDGCFDIWGDASGLAFVIHQDIRGVQALGGIGANLGLYDWGGVGGTANALVIEMDSWNNILVPQLLDDLINQIHVITTDSRGKLTEIYEAQCKSHHSEPRTVVVSYDGSHMTIDHSGCTAKHSFPLDLNSIFDGPRVYMGFAGATSTVTSTQEIWSWSFRQECF
jgi:hypothetical protein